MDTTTDIERLLAEGPVTSVEAARTLGRMRVGRPVHPSTISRWIRAGHLLPDGRRVRLEGILVGRKLLTTRAALVRFLAAQQPAAGVPVAPVRSPAARRRGNSQAMDTLADEGAI